MRRAWAAPPSLEHPLITCESVVVVVVTVVVVFGRSYPALAASAWRHLSTAPSCILCAPGKDSFRVSCAIGVSAINLGMLENSRQPQQQSTSMFPKATLFCAAVCNFVQHIFSPVSWPRPCTSLRDEAAMVSARKRARARLKLKDLALEKKVEAARPKPPSRPESGILYASVLKGQCPQKSQPGPDPLGSGPLGPDRDPPSSSPLSRALPCSFVKTASRSRTGRAAGKKGYIALSQTSALRGFGILFHGSLPRPPQPFLATSCSLKNEPLPDG